MSPRSSLAAALACFALVGCAATTKVETTGTALKQPLCGAGSEKLSALVYWGPQWRPDQKEPPAREAAAQRGIQAFFAGSDCLVLADLRRLPGERSAEVPSDAELLRLASSAAPLPDSVMLIVVRELGPRLVIGIPALVEGGTEVVVDVRVLNVRSSEPMADVRTHWQNGGTFIIKGVKTLEEDLGAALRSTLMSPSP